MKNLKTLLKATLAGATAALLISSAHVELPRAWAANIDIPGLTAATSVTGTDLYECSQAGHSHKCTITQLSTFLGTSLASLAGNQTFTGANTFGEVIGGTRAVTTTTDTLASIDCGKTITYNNAAAITVTIPQGLPIVCVIAIMQLGAGKVSVNGTAVTPATFHTNVAGGTATGTSQQYSTISITNYVANTVVMAGDGS